MTILLIILALVTLILSIYLGFLVTRLKKKRADNEKMANDYQQSFLKRRKDVLDSLYTLALVMEQGQVSIAEGCIRIKKLIDLDEELRFHADLADFHKAYLDFSEFSYLDSYKDLSNQEKFSEDLKRQQVEIKYEQKLVEASGHLKTIVSTLLKNLNSA